MTDKALRDHVLYVLRDGGAHLSFDKAVANLAPEARGAKAEAIPYTPWQILEHMRICQWDILEFSRNAAHVSPDFPDGYWPDSATPPSADAWDRSVEAFRTDRQAMQELVADPVTDLLARIPHGDGQTILREAFLIADHNAYHLGQLVVIRRGLGEWHE